LSTGKKKEIKIKSSNTLVRKSKRAPAKGSQNRTDRERGHDQTVSGAKSDGYKRASVKATEKKASRQYADSARQYADDVNQAIKFYKIAISFNQYNLKAWQGLIVAYRNAGMTKEATEARKKMEELFGREISTIREVVAPYGELTDYSLDHSGVCRIEYRSKLRKQPELERETYLLIRAVLVKQHCNTVSLYASTGTGSGLLVRIDTRGFPSSVSAYKKRAAITFVE
jgi:tetratricopeptide (TPR) repeat protein